MNKVHRPNIRKFNPGLFQTDREVISQFVVRQVEFKTVLEIVRENLDSPSCQHTLVIAPRGRGKTMLLARLAAECRTNEKYSRRIVPVRFMEECYEIFTLADFWLEALNGLAKEITASDPETSLELKKAHAEFKSRWRERDIAYSARAAVLDTAERLDKHLVLMVENLQSLVDDVDEDFGWGLRHALQTEPRLTLVATATSRFRALGDVEHAFFELFRPVHLDPLDSKSCHRLWHELGGGERSETEIEPVRILTGGSPRLIAIIASFASHFSLDRLLDELVDLIDSHTEYFRGHLDGMPKTERRVYLALADLWRPSTTGEVAARASLGIRTVSTMLGRLADRGAVLVGGTGGKREYSAAEGLYCIYYKLRRDQGAAQIVRDLIRFMRLVFTEREQKQIFGMLSLELPMQQALHHGVELAITDEPSIADLIPSELQIDDGPSWPSETPISGISAIDEIEAAFKELDFEKVVQMADECLEGQKDPSGPDEELIALRMLVRKAQALQRSTDFQGAAETCLAAVRRFSKNSDPEIQSHVALARIVRFASEVKEGNFDAANETFREFRDQFPAEASVPMRLVAQEMLNAASDLFLDNQLEEAEQILNEFNSRFSPRDYPTFALLYTAKALVLGQAGLLEDAISTCDQTIAQFKDNPETAVRTSIAYALMIVALLHMGKYPDAIAACDIVEREFGTETADPFLVAVSTAMCGKADAQILSFKFEEAIGTCEALNRRFGSSDNPHVLSNVIGASILQAWALADTGRANSALRKCDDIEGILSRRQEQMRNFVLRRLSWVRLKAYTALENHASGKIALHSAFSKYDLDDDDDVQELLHFTVDAIAKGTPEQYFLEVFADAQKQSEQLTPMLVALKRRVDQTVRAPVEIVAIADGIQKMIEGRRNEILERK